LKHFKGDKGSRYFNCFSYAWYSTPDWLDTRGKPFEFIILQNEFKSRWDLEGENRRIVEEKDDSRELKSMCCPYFTDTKKGW